MDFVGIAYWLIIGCIGMFLVGFLTVKVLIWGGFATILLYVLAPVTPGISGDEVLRELGPHLNQMVVAFPVGLGNAFGTVTSTGDAMTTIVGGATVIITGIIFAPLYIAGACCGLLFWPELFLF